MSWLRIVLASAGLVAACRALPSAIPLADTGEGRAFDDGALSRNRVPFGERRPGDVDVEHDDEPSGDDTVAIVAHETDAGDAGTPDASLAASDAGGIGSKWAGEYFGSDRQVTRVTGVPDKTDLDDKAHTRVEEPSPGALVISLVSSSDGQVICALHARADGNEAEFEPNVSCPGLMLMPPLEVEGAAKLDGEKLVLDLEGHGEFPTDDRPLEMAIEYHFEGKRR
jgi:hypothetical protein